MTVPFMTKFPDSIAGIGGQATQFVPKIWHSLVTMSVEMRIDDFCYTMEALPLADKDLINRVLPKHHTLRVDPHNRYHPGVKLHMVINNRTPQRRQFAPVVPCISTQTIWISPHSKSVRVWRLDTPVSNPDSVLEGWWEKLPFDVVDDIARNDGFSSTDDFFAYFNAEWGGKIIHWTNLKY